MEDQEHNNQLNNVSEPNQQIGATPDEQPIARVEESPPRSSHGFEFVGNAGEYFRIWIVNVVLTICSFGIYSAWAKVRTKQYFYGNTILDGSTFQYTGDPKLILKGRLVALALFTAYASIDRFFPDLGGAALLVASLLVPAIIVLSLSFRMRNTVWRGIRFDFEQNFTRAYLLFSPPLIYLALTVFIPLYLGIDREVLENPDINSDVVDIPPAIQFYLGLTFAAISLGGLIFPWWQKAYFVFVANRTLFGSSKFTFIALALEFYGIYMLAFLVLLGGFIGFLEVIAILENMISDSATYVAVLAFVIPYAMAAAYVQTQRTNIIFSNLELNDITFNSGLEPKTMMYLYTTNTLAIIFSFGLAIPWSMIRMARYRAKTMKLLAADFSVFRAKPVDAEKALGEEVGDIFNLEIGL